MGCKKNIGYIVWNIKMYIKYAIIKITNTNNKKFKALNIMDDSKTINDIIKNKKSICRYGDGEFCWMLNIESPEFQDNDENLQKRLCEIIKSDNENILICIPRILKDNKNINPRAKLFWQDFKNKNGNNVLKFLQNDKIYGNTNFTRFYMDYFNKNGTKEKILKIKELWDNREVVMIEGEFTKLGVGNDLFDNCKSIERILCPAKNAFSKYDEILDACKKNDKNKLLLIALGPTATVLAYDLGVIGYQALDIGHVDIEYEWYLKKAKVKAAIEGKAVNEVRSKEYLNTTENDKNYLDSIITKIK